MLGHLPAGALAGDLIRRLAEISDGGNAVDRFAIVRRAILNQYPPTGEDRAKLVHLARSAPRASECIAEHHQRQVVSLETGYGAAPQCRTMLATIHNQRI